MVRITVAARFGSVIDAARPRHGSRRRGRRALGSRARTRAPSRGRARASIPSGLPAAVTSSVMGSKRRKLAPRAPPVPATRNTADPTGKPAASRRRALVRVEPIRVALHEGLHGGIVRAGGLHDRPPVRIRPRDGLHPGRDGPLARRRAPDGARRGRRRGWRRGRARPGPRSRTSSGPPTRTSPSSGQARHVVRHRAAARWCRVARAAHSSTRSAPPRRSPNDRAAARAQRPGRLAHHARRSPPSSDAERAAARGARGRLAAGAAARGDAVAGQRREEEAAPGAPERAHQPRGAPLGTRAHDLDRRPSPAARVRPPARPERGRLRRRTQRREHARRAGQPRALERDVPHVVVRARDPRGAPGCDSRDTTIRPRPPAARTPRAASPRPRRTRPAWMSSHIR